MKYCNHRWILSMIGMWLVCTSCNEPVIENQSEETEGRPSIINPDEGDGISEESNKQQKFPNYFKEGTEWAFNVSNIYYPDYMMKHILDGKVQIGDKEWLKLWVENEDDLGKKKQKGYISTEGERVYYHRDEEDVEGSLLYDFGLGIGDTIVVPAIYTDWDITMKCVGKKTVMSCGHTYDVQLMATMNTEATEDYDLGQWYYGIGEIDYDSEYGNWGHGISMVGNNSKILQQVICNGETIFDRNDVTETSEQ